MKRTCAIRTTSTVSADGKISLAAALSWTFLSNFYDCARKEPLAVAIILTDRASLMRYSDEIGFHPVEQSHTHSHIPDIGDPSSLIAIPYSLIRL
jgi:hypothetical protein